MPYATPKCQTWYQHGARIRSGKSLVFICVRKASVRRIWCWEKGELSQTHDLAGQLCSLLTESPRPEEETFEQHIECWKTFSLSLESRSINNWELELGSFSTSQMPQFGDDRVLTLQKVVPVKSHNNFSSPLVETEVVWLNRNRFCKVRTHFYHDASTYDWFCDRRVSKETFVEARQAPHRPPKMQ